MLTVRSDGVTPRAVKVEDGGEGARPMLTRYSRGQSLARPASRIPEGTNGTRGDQGNDVSRLLSAF